MPLDKLNLWNTKIADLALKGLPNKQLSVGATKVTDLTPIQGMALICLDIGNSAVSDLTPITGMPLMKFYAGNSKITTLARSKGRRWGIW